jgi:cyclohexa-1,5-dienecarbonyl-CoA hydratase
MVESGFVHIRYEASDGVGTLTLDRPPVNVMNIAMLQEMEKGLERAKVVEDLKVLVIRAEGKFFSAGVDVADHTPELVGDMIPLFDRVCQMLAEFPVPTIAVVNGHALGGGCEIVICCDFALMVDGARIGQPEIQLASMAPIAALRLPMLVGPRWAAQILFTGEQISASKAADIGLIDNVVAPDDLERAVGEQIEKITQLSAVALRINKKGYLLGLAGWDDGLGKMETLYLDELMSTADAIEGLEAFLEKRPAEWKNR